VNSSGRQRISGVIEALNAIEVGEISAIVHKLRMAEEELGGLDVGELQATLGEARKHLDDGDVTNFRRLVAQAISKLGHFN